MSAQATWSQPTLTPNPHICIHLRAFVSTRRTRPGNWSSKMLISKSHKDLKTNQPHYFPASSASSPLSRLCHTSTGVTWARTCGGAWAREKWTRAREHIIFWSSWPGTDLALGLCDYVARSQEDGQCTLLRSPKDIRYSQSAVKLCQIIQRIKNRTEKAFGGILLSGTGKKPHQCSLYSRQLAYLKLFRRNCRVMTGCSWLNRDADAQGNFSSARGFGFRLKPFQPARFCQVSSLQPKSMC